MNLPREHLAIVTRVIRTISHFTVFADVFSRVMLMFDLMPLKCAFVHF